MFVLCVVSTLPGPSQPSSKAVEPGAASSPPRLEFGSQVPAADGEGVLSFFEFSWFWPRSFSQWVWPLAVKSKATPRAEVSDPVKTKVCTYFQQGRCTKGEACTFLHEELQEACEMESLLLQYFAHYTFFSFEIQYVKVEPLCKVQHSLFLQLFFREVTPVKTKVCTYFQQGRCTKGEACTFLHEELQEACEMEPLLLQYFSRYTFFSSEIRES